MCPNNPRDDFRLTYNCLACPDNCKTYNDGYHILHHANSRLHWSKLPTAFTQQLSKHEQHDGECHRACLWTCGVQLCQPYLHVGVAIFWPYLMVITMLHAKLTWCFQIGHDMHVVSVCLLPWSVVLLPICDATACRLCLLQHSCFLALVCLMWGWQCLRASWIGWQIMWFLAGQSKQHAASRSGYNSCSIA